MTKVTFASHPHMLGFEQLDRLLERSTKAGADSYPPYNIEQIGENAYRITLAVAGFTECDLSVVIQYNREELSQIVDVILSMPEEGHQE